MTESSRRFWSGGTLAALRLSGIYTLVSLLGCDFLGPVTLLM